MSVIRVMTTNGVEVTINSDNILYAEPNGERCKIHLVGGPQVNTNETYESVSGKMEGPILEPIEGELLSTESQVTPEKTQEQQAAEGTAAIAAEIERQAAEAAKTADADNPANKRETTGKGKNPAS